MKYEALFGSRFALVFLLITALCGPTGEVWAVAHGETNSSGPAGGGEEGSNATDEVSVDESSGAVRLSIPVELPSGPNSQQPSVGLRYASTAGNGLVGVGWSLPISKISCSTRFGVPDYQSCTRFELDGEVLVGPAPGSTPAVAEYHTFKESFARIRYFAATNQWAVTSVEGVTKTYGGTHPSDARSGASSGGTAEWYLDRVQDPFDNVMHYEYEMGPSGSDPDAGYLRPSVIRYGGGIAREVEFTYETRPDPIVNYSGGVRMRMSERLSGIKIFVQGQLHSRLLLAYEQSISSNVSRLVSAQRFGSDCDPDAVSLTRGPGCSALPAMEFSYTDSGAISREARWEEMGKPADTSDPAWFVSGAPTFTTGNLIAFGVENVQLGDVNGDGYSDIIFDAEGRHDEENSVTPGIGLDRAAGSPEVHLHNGRTGPEARWVRPTWNGGSPYPSYVSGQVDSPDNLSAEWTDRLRGLRFDLPSLRVKQVMSLSADVLSEEIFDAGGSVLDEYGTAAFGTCIESSLNDSLPQVIWKGDAGSVQLGKRAPYMAAPSWDSTQSRNLGPDDNGYDPYSAHRPLLPESTPYESEIRAFPHFQVVDLNADGRADFVMSVHLSGFNLSLDDCATAQVVDAGDEVWIPGATTRVVFVNNGVGWDLDDARSATDGNLADSLPVMAIIAFESSDLAYLRMHAGSTAAISGSNLSSPCDDAGLSGVRGPVSGTISPVYPFNFESWDFCVTSYDLTPVFQDLNGDGYVDILVKETSDIDALFHGWRPEIHGWTPEWRTATTESVAWIQNPHAEGSEPRWTREPAFDPPVSHAYVAQWGLDTSPPSKPQVHNLDRGLRFVDLNRDGLVDILADTGHPFTTPFPGIPSAFRGAILNRGAEPGAARHSAWCASAPIGVADVCSPDAARYAPPEVFSPIYTDDIPGWNRSTVRSISNGQLFEVVDISGDGWVDILTTAPVTGAPVAYIHHPGRAGSVWVEDPDYAPDAEGNLYREVCRNVNGCGVTPEVVLTSGYGFFDANGDGVLDIIASNDFSFPEKESLLSTEASAHSDLLATYANGLGAYVEFRYASPRVQRDDALEAKAEAHAVAPLLNGDAADDARAEVLAPAANPSWPTVPGQVVWPLHPVLASKTVSSANAAPATTSYRYAHPRRCIDHQKEFGFRLVEVTNADQSTVESFYFQKHGRAGKLAERTHFDENGSPILFTQSDWETPDPSQVVGGLRLGNGDLYDVAHIGRLKSTLSRNEYGAIVGVDPGFETRTEYVYDDAHGYNFIAEELRTAPGRNARVENTPHPIDAARHLVMRRSGAKTYANQAYDTRLLSRQQFSYFDRANRNTYDKPGMVREYIASRDDPQASDWRRTYYAYTAQGNLSERRIQLSDSAAADGRVTQYCYDGDPGCDIGQDSHSLLVKTWDADGRLASHATPHAVFSESERGASYYEDLPSSSRDLDAFGRVLAEWFEPESGPAVKLMEVEYFDFPTSGLAHGGGFQPFRIFRKYADAGGPATIETISVESGTGSEMMSIMLLGSVSGGASSVASFATERWSDPAARESGVSERFACPATQVTSAANYGSIVAACSAVSDFEKTEVKTRSDALGRSLRVDTPLGFELFRYASSAEVVIGSGASTPHDAILHKNANGGLREMVMAGGMPVRVRDCNNATLDPNLADLSFATCDDADESRLAYEPTGELRERIDPTAADNGGYNGFNVGAFSNQRLRYSYDTLGRMTRIEDPDAGVSEQNFDVFDNLSSTTDARGITIVKTYDALNRPTQISSPNEPATNFIYTADSLRVSRILLGGIAEKLFAYDELGRVSREIRWVDRRMMRTEYAFDLLGRPTWVKYPTVVNGAVDAIGYDYDGQFLERICDIGADDSEDCGSAEAETIVSNVVHDALGRVESMEIPGGTRSFVYDGNSARRTRDDFVSGTAGQDVRFAYEMPGGGDRVPAYDSLGNLLRVEATLGTGGGSTTYQHEYAYDARNRVDAWKWNGTETDYDYDRRGNLIKRADAIQDFSSIATAHAIQSKTTPDGATFSYTYDAAGNLASRSSSSGESLYYSFDDRGRLTCAGQLPGSCNELEVSYSGDGERVKEIGSSTYVYAGPDFRYRRDASGNVGEYWIEIRAGGDRIAYKHVYGGALRIVEMFPGWEIPRGLGDGLLVLGFILLASGGVAFLVFVKTQPRPVYGAACASLTLVAVILPIQVWAGGAITNSHGAGSEAFRWVMSDMIGSGLVELDAAGQRLSHQAYEPFGDVVESYGSSGVASRKYFAGHDRQLDVDLVYMNARWMDPGSGTFISVDPVVREATVSQTFNGYAYVENNPVTSIDPTGMWSEECPGCEFPSPEPEIEVGNIDSDVDAPVPGNQDETKIDPPAPTPDFPPLTQRPEVARGSQGGGPKTNGGLPPGPWSIDEIDKAGGGRQGAAGPSRLGAAGMMFFAGGTIAGLGELGGLHSGQGKGGGIAKSGARSPSGGGAGTTAGRSAALARAAGFRTVGRLFFATGVVVSVGQWLSGEVSTERMVVDIAMSGVSTFGGPVGLAAGTTYFLSMTIVDVYGQDVGRAGPRP